MGFEKDLLAATEIIGQLESKLELLNAENLALDDELKICKKERKNCQAAWEEQLEKIAILEAKLEAKERAKSKKICPFYYGRPNGTDFCKEGQCPMWDNKRGCLFAAEARSIAHWWECQP